MFHGAGSVKIFNILSRGPHHWREDRGGRRGRLRWRVRAKRSSVQISPEKCRFRELADKKYAIVKLTVYGMRISGGGASGNLGRKQPSSCCIWQMGGGSEYVKAWIPSFGLRPEANFGSGLGETFENGRRSINYA